MLLVDVKELSRKPGVTVPVYFELTGLNRGKNTQCGNWDCALEHYLYGVETLFVITAVFFKNFLRKKDPERAFSKLKY